ncbi:MAG: hypothetical protein P8X54_09315 [Desulfuromonadales bacterium]
MPSLAVLYDPESGQWQRFDKLVEEIEVHALDKVIPTIDYLNKRVEEEELYAAGFISYEAAAAFDEALQTRNQDDFPLLRFGLFASLEFMQRLAVKPPGRVFRKDRKNPRRHCPWRNLPGQPDLSAVR